LNLVPARILAVGLLAALLSFQPCTVDGATAGKGAPRSGAQRREVQVPIRDFSLVDQSGRPFAFGGLKGKVVVAGFAYTTCPDVCPLMTAAMRRVQESLSPTEHGAVYFLTVTTDPEIDSPKVLAGYAKRHGADLSNWAFVTGADSSLRPVWKNFGVGVRRVARGLIDHTPLTAIIDKRGTMRMAYHGAAPDPAPMLQDIRSLLAER
jgi:protein SCO1/2